MSWTGRNSFSINFFFAASFAPLANCLKKAEFFADSVGSRPDGLMWVTDTDRLALLAVDVQGLVSHRRLPPSQFSPYDLTKGRVIFRAR